MKTIAIILIASMAVTACGNRLGKDGAGMGAGGGITNDSYGAGAGGAGDPNSVAYFQQSVGDRVLFLVDQSTITPEAASILAGQARWMNANPEYTALVEGHADEQGTREYNLALGGRRANAVRDYLIGQGVSSARLRTISYGKERPLAVCSTEECYSQNRRSVTVLGAGAGV